ncbi:MAG: alanine racemase [Magnetococcales bacterium]|nr:alanine racemase [Magnetococcales bacterium]NGZ05913.1 alanine racemase [Magnetococcales bacterium]
MMRHPPGRPTWLEIDLSAIVHNFQVVQRTVGPDCAIYPAIKANGYGLGAVPIARTLARAGARGFCVAMTEEAIPLRAAGIDQPIVLLSGFIPGLEQQVVALDLEPVIFDLEAAHRLSRLRGPQDPPLIVHVKIDTGMGRIGFDAEQLHPVMTELDRLPGIRVHSLLSHFAWADEAAGQTATRNQLQRFHQAHASLGVRGAALQLSCANSAGLLAYPEARLSWVRPGIMLYGASPFHPYRTAQMDGLRPVVRWITHVLSIRQVPSGTPLGYGHEYVTQRPSRIALLPVGYADGYPRILKGHAQILTHGQRAPVVGRISMDLTLVDVTDIPQAVTGSRVTLLGADGDGFIGIEEMADWSATIPYEVICRFGMRVPRHHLPEIP